MKRIQLRRVKGFTIPAKTQVCTRPLPLGNPFRVGEELPTVVKCISMFKLWAEAAFEFPKDRSPEQIRFVEAFERLEANPPDHLACFCGLADKCHVDVILDLYAKRKAERDGSPGRTGIVDVAEGLRGHSLEDAD